MIPKAFRLINSRKGLDKALIFLMALIPVGMIGTLLLDGAAPSRPPAVVSDETGFLPGLGKLLVWLSLAGIGVLAAVVFGFLRRTFIQPFNQLVQLGRDMTETDFTVLTDAMSELARGNFSGRLAVQAKPLPVSVSSEISELVGVFNGMIKSLEEIVHEFNSVNDVPCLRLCFVGGDVYLQGRLSGETMGKAIGGRRAEVLVLTGHFHATGQELRRKGFLSLLNEKYPEIQIVEVMENREDPELAYRQTRDVLKRVPNLAGIYITEGATPQGVARAVVEAKKEKQIKIICHDITDETMRYVKDGVITATIGDNAFAQGHDPVIHLFNHLAAGWQPTTPRQLIDMDVVTQVNCRHFWEEGKGIIQSSIAMQRLAKPMDAQTPKALRLAVIGCENSSCWYPVRDGALAAAESLKPFNVTVRWIAPKQDLTAEVCAPIIQSLIDEKVDGIAAIIEQRELVPHINRAVEAGIPVISYITEPVSLKGLLFTVIEQAGKLMGLSGDLSESANRVNVATTKISKAMNEMAAGVVSQDAQISDTRGNVQSLIQNIDRVSRESQESANAVDRTAKAVTVGTDAMGKTMTSMQTIEQSVTNTWKVVDELAQHSNRIDSIVELIRDIASRVNVLALNAVIEATRAGESGRGFMVVANEIRTLAKNTREASGQVTDLIQVVKSDIGKIEKVMSEGLEKVKQSAGLTDEAMRSMRDIRHLVEVHKQRMQNIAESLTRMQSFSQKVGEAMEKVASVSSQNAAVVEGVSQSTVEMSSQLEGVTASAQLLEAMAMTEQQLLARFDLSGMGPA
jgi:methyl-accepting chemotaxis protein/ABC-type sugar transport system substrate-binding protein